MHGDRPLLIVSVQCFGVVACVPHRRVRANGAGEMRAASHDGGRPTHRPRGEGRHASRRTDVATAAAVACMRSFGARRRWRCRRLGACLTPHRRRRRVAAARSGGEVPPPPLCRCPPPFPTPPRLSEWKCASRGAAPLGRRWSAAPPPEGHKMWDVDQTLVAILPPLRGSGGRSRRRSAFAA